MQHVASPALQLWAGFECTLNRVGDRRFDQLARSGHYQRDDDLDRIAALGVRTIRYPVLWERIEGGTPDGRPWEWTDERMRRLHTLGVDPIIGLMHHGSGPVGTDLLDESFPERLAAFAAQVAARYPWVTRFTPVNEPLTTARFSALYGIWYPHACDDALFLRALLNQVRATRLAMECIRRVTPAAQLVQTEDLGRTHSTRALAGQAAFENERRWLTFDLLTGRVTPSHPLWEYLRQSGVGADDVARAVGDGCVPALLGINHYVTSERWLDERLERYPAHTHGGNHHQRYADVEAVRACPRGVAGPAALLGEAWERYGIPLAVTEAHIGCTREQQMRWLQEMWRAAHTARASGADVRAVTAWAALGAYDWSTLVTRDQGEYESGLFDARYSRPRRTALATMARALATAGHYDHPVLAERGWWRHPARMIYAADGDEVELDGPPAESNAPTQARPILLVGTSGPVGDAFARICTARGLAHHASIRGDLDAHGLARLLDETDAWATVIAGSPAHARELARVCSHRNLPFATFSAVDTLHGLERALLIRANWTFGPWDEENVVTASLRRIANGIPVGLPDDLLVSPGYLPHVADATLDLLIDGEHGPWHLANSGTSTVADLVRRAARDAGLDAALVHADEGAQADGGEYRPVPHEREAVMPSLDRALHAYVQARPWEQPCAPRTTLVACNELLAV